MDVEQQPVTGDEGFSVLEMVVALAVLSVTMVASAPFFVNSLTSVNRQRTRQAAIQLAETAMEQVRGLKGSALLTGRSTSATQTQFNTVLSADATTAGFLTVAKPFVSQMEAAGDPMITDTSSTAGADAPIPTSAQQVTVEGTTYTQNIFVGKCEVYLTGTTECVYPKGAAAPADTTKILQFFRVVVLENWADPSACRTTANTCSYVATTLVSRASEPNFDFNRPAPQVLDNSQTWYVGDTVSYQMQARGGQLPNTWTVGALPPGLTMTAAGLVSGTATTATATGGLVTTTTVTDHVNRNSTGSVTFTVLAQPVATVPVTVVTSRIGDTYSLALTATGGKSPYTYAVTGLPPGLALDATTNTITGSPTTNGTYTVSVITTDANNHAGPAKTYTQTVNPALTLSGLSDQTIDLKTKLDLTAVAGGGDGKYTYTGTNLPPGVTVNKNSGAVSGKSTASGRFLPTITATDGSGGTLSQQIAVIVTTSDSLIFTAPALTAPDQTTAKGTAASLALATNGTLLGLSPTITVTGLPAGLSYNALTATIAGTPTTAGTYTVTATATSLTPASTSILTLVWKIT